MEVASLEPWLTKKQLAEYLSCSERWLEYRLQEKMPSTMMGNRRKFRASEVESWLEEHGYMERNGHG